MQSGTYDLDGLRGLLEMAGVRCTQQRLLLAELVLSRRQHLSADQVFALANRGGHLVSKATVYNTLNLFARLGLVREVIVDPHRLFYDSNISDHHHVYNEDDGALTDVDAGSVEVRGLPELPADTEVQGIEVIVRIRSRRP
jgi:Fur family iron response transcriptional regulator